MLVSSVLWNTLHKRVLLAISLRCGDVLVFHNTEFTRTTLFWVRKLIHLAGPRPALDLLLLHLPTRRKP